MVALQGSCEDKWGNSNISHLLSKYHLHVLPQSSQQQFEWALVLSHFSENWGKERLFS